MNADTRILPREPVDGRGNDARANHDRRPDPHFARRRIGEEFDVLHGLLELIEGIETAVEQRAPVNGRLDPALTSIKQADPERIFQVGDGLRYRGLRHRQLSGSLSHAAATGNRHQDVQIPKIEVPAEPPLSPFHRVALIINNCYALIE